MSRFEKVPNWIFLLILILAAPGCGPSETPAGTDSPAPSSTIPVPEPTFTETLPAPTPEDTPQPTPVPLERPHYSITADLDYQTKRLVVEEKILIPHPANEALDSIELVVPPNSWPGVFTIQELSAEHVSVENFDLSGVLLKIEFGSPGWQPNENLQLTIDYSLDLPPQNAREGFGAFALLASHPFKQIWLIGTQWSHPIKSDLGWIVHDPWLFGEYLVYPAADFEVSLKLGTPGLTAAASSTPLNEGDPLLYSLEEARNFVFSISPSYIVLEADVLGTSVMGYIFPGYQVPGQAAFEATIDALELYSELYGPYDQPGLSMVQADFNHGMEYEGLYFQSRGFFDTYNGSEQSYLVTIAVHETAHQWWYGQVANDQALEPWLDEALCTFSELAYYEQRYPQSVDWWWGTRVNFYEPEGRIDRSIYDFQGYVDQYLAYRKRYLLAGSKVHGSPEK